MDTAAQLRRVEQALRLLLQDARNRNLDGRMQAVEQTLQRLNRLTAEEAEAARQEGEEGRGDGDATHAEEHRRILEALQQLREEAQTHDVRLTQHDRDMRARSAATYEQLMQLRRTPTLSRDSGANEEVLRSLRRHDERLIGHSQAVAAEHERMLAAGRGEGGEGGLEEAAAPPQEEERGKAEEAGSDEEDISAPDSPPFSSAPVEQESERREEGSGIKKTMREEETRGGCSARGRTRGGCSARRRGREGCISRRGAVCSTNTAFSARRAKRIGQAFGQGTSAAGGAHQR